MMGLKTFGNYIIEYKDDSIMLYKEQKDRFGTEYFILVREESNTEWCDFIKLAVFEIKEKEEEKA